MSSLLPSGATLQVVAPGVVESLWLKEGPAGPPGDAGPPGASFVPQGTVPTSGDLPVSGEDGEGWIADDTGHLWVWVDGDWVDVGDFRGPEGPAGPANTLTKGTVGYVEDPEDADFTITGAAPNQTLNLLLPRGESGAGGVTSIVLPGGPETGDVVLDADAVEARPAGDVPWAELDDVPAEFTPSDHASTHGVAGSDPVSIAAGQVTSGQLDFGRLGGGAPAPGRYVDGGTGDWTDFPTPFRPSPDVRRLAGPLAVTDDIATITVNAAADPAYNKSYIIAGTSFPAGWPIDMGYTSDAFAGNFNYPERLNSATRRLRFEMDGEKFATYTDAVGTIGDSFLLFVNGAPVSLTPTAWGAGVSLTTFVFPTAKPRIIELLTTVGINSVYTHNPYRLWKPDPLRRPRVLFVGDSYTAGATFNTSSGVTEAPRLNGWSAQIGFHLGIEDWIVDGIGGTGFIVGGAGEDFNERLADHVALAPDVIVVGGGGSNDLFQGQTTSAIIAAATDYLSDARAALPAAKLVFVEGFAPPTGFSTFNDEYTAIRVALQAALATEGVYYVDVASTSPWIDGTGKIGATTGTGNSDVYIGGDGIHLSIAGHRYVRERLAPKLRTILADGGDLLNTMI